jgi:hypothetical protein
LLELPLLSPTILFGIGQDYQKEKVAPNKKSVCKDTKHKDDMIKGGGVKH